MKSEHRTNFGKIPNVEKSITVNFTEKRTIPILQNNKNRITWLPDTASGVFLTITCVIMFKKV